MISVMQSSAFFYNKLNKTWRKYMILILFFIIFLLVLIIAAFVFVMSLQQKAKNFSREVFGTDDLKRVANDMQEAYSSTPKSVSAMTSLLLPKITADFPDFNYNEMKDRTNNLLTSYLNAITQGSEGVLNDGNAELKQKLSDYIAGKSLSGLREHFESIHIHRTEICQYRKSEGRCIITFQTSLECYHYTTSLADNSVKEGSKEYKYQTRFNTDLIYVQDVSKSDNEYDQALGLNCPNCGAPLTSLGAKHCEYCGTPIIEYNIKAWTFSNIDEVN
jgi:hypothetical protein